MKRTFNVLTSERAIILAAVGVDIGCGVMAVETDLNARFLSDNRKGIRESDLVEIVHTLPQVVCVKG
jgi:tRNA-splicing ligase RtcB